MMFDWTEARITMLRECVAAGQSSGVAAAHFTRETRELVKRNALISKAAKLGIHFHSKSSGTAKKPQPRRRRRSAHTEETLAQFAGERLPPVEFTPDPISVDADAIPVEQRVSLLELTAHICRWPYGDPGTPSFFFCGALGADNPASVPYCAAHSSIAYRRPPKLEAAA